MYMGTLRSHCDDYCGLPIGNLAPDTVDPRVVQMSAFGCKVDMAIALRGVTAQGASKLIFWAGQVAAEPHRGQPARATRPLGQGANIYRSRQTHSYRGAEANTGLSGCSLLYRLQMMQKFFG